MKSLPLAYNKDMQEDKEAVFDAVDTVKACLAVFCGMLQSITFHKDVMYRSAQGGYTNATDAADWLVKKGVAFRDAHEIVGRLVSHAVTQGKPLEELTLDEFKSFCDTFDQTVYRAISVQQSVNSRNIIGGTSQSAVEQAIKNAERFLQEIERDGYKVK